MSGLQLGMAEMTGMPDCEVFSNVNKPVCSVSLCVNCHQSPDKVMDYVGLYKLSKSTVCPINGDG